MSGLLVSYKATFLFLLLLCVSKATAQVELSTASEVFSVDSEVFFSERNNKNESVSELKNSNISTSSILNIALPGVSESELEDLGQSSREKLVSIGLGREIPSPYKDSMVSVLTDWEEYTDGGYLTRFSITSPGAEALRLNFSISSIPSGVELRFFSPDNVEESVGPFGMNMLMQERVMNNSGVSANYWSPTIQGETLAVEIYLPPSASPEDFVFSIVQLSHLVSSPFDSSESFKNLSQLGNSGSCNIDIACIGDVSPQIIASVAKYLFTENDGYTYICTGTLLVDTDTSSSIPYFLTAQHCVNKQAQAANTEFYWFFQRSGCGGADPSTVTRQVGGSDLLISLSTVDMSLLRLRTSPPDGVSFSGWSSESLVSGSELLGIHHPGGDLKKGSVGKMDDFAPLFSLPDGRGAYIQLTWSRGVTEGGSSGSGIWRQISGKRYLVGTLTGGSSACVNRTSPDYYGRFDLAFSSLKRFLAPTSGDGEDSGSAEGRLLNISTNSFVSDGGVISGFIITGGARRVVVMGESAGSELDPVIKLTNKSGEQILHVNDDWKSDATASEVVVKLRAPRSSSDAAFAITLQPGAYLAKLYGADSSIGKGIISVTEVIK